MNIFITGICGFVGSALARWFRQRSPDIRVAGMDNFIRAGSEINRPALKALGVDVRHGDVRNASDFEVLPGTDWVIDAAANPSVLAGRDGAVSPRQLLEHNLQSTINVLEYCRRVRAGLVLLSTSRVYSIQTLNSLALVIRDNAFALDDRAVQPAGVSLQGVQASCSTAPPLSLYGSSKLASELLAVEYAEAFSVPVWINRCGVLAGAGQFGRAEQGIYSYWVHSYAKKRPLKYIGFGGHGHQIRDALHPDDLAELVYRQMTHSGSTILQPFNVGGGVRNAMSLAQLSAWCADRFGQHAVSSDHTSRPYDIPWLIMDNAETSAQFGWSPRKSLADILQEIADHAVRHDEWLELTGNE